MNTNAKMYFDAHKKHDLFYFTPDGQAFFDEADAAAHSLALEKAKKGTGKVTAVTREQVVEWWKEQAPKELAAAELAVTQAEKVEDEAQKSVNSLPPGTTPSKKLAANAALAKASKAVAAAIAHLEGVMNDQPVGDSEDDNDGEEGEDEQPTPEEKKAAAEKTLADAKTRLEAAQAAKTELLTNAEVTTKQKGDATKAVNQATLAVDQAQAALDELLAAE